MRCRKPFNAIRLKFAGVLLTYDAIISGTGDFTKPSTSMSSLSRFSDAATRMER